MKMQLAHELRVKGLRATKARLAMLELFSNAQKPLDADSIKKSLDKKDVSADIATIYRFLNTFIDEGILYKIEFGEGKYRYELATLPHHHHLVCNNCGTVEDVQVDEKNFTAKVESASNFKIDHHHLEFFGTCHSCQ